MTSPTESAGSTLPSPDLERLRTVYENWRDLAAIVDSAVGDADVPRSIFEAMKRDADLAQGGLDDALRESAPALLAMADRLATAERERDEYGADLDRAGFRLGKALANLSAAEARASQMAEALGEIDESARRSMGTSNKMAALARIAARASAALTAPPPPGAPGSGRA